MSYIFKAGNNLTYNICRSAGAANGFVCKTNDHRCKSDLRLNGR
jgi:hypothetical protein